jgi:hypothetical protein
MRYGGSATIPLAAGLIDSLRRGLRRSAKYRYFILFFIGVVLGRHIGLPLHKTFIMNYLRA